MIEIFGNSHAAVITGAPPSGNAVPRQHEIPRGRGFTEKNPNYPFRTWFLGPVLAYNFYENHLPKLYAHISKNPEIFHHNNDVTLLLAVGEIDCRVHLPKYVTGQKSVKDVVEECVTRYHKALIDIKEKGYRVAAMGAIPSLSDESMRKESIRLNILKDLEQNVSGDTTLRNKIVKCWESTHSDMCKRDEIPYISIYKNLIDENGMTKEEFYCDHIHLSHEKTLKLWLSAFEENKLLKT